jgi:hypothetical protein
MSQIVARVAVRAFLAAASSTAVNAAEVKCTFYDSVPAVCVVVDSQPVTAKPVTPCASGYELACHARDHGTDGLRRSEQHK